jgi:hypothetical protein
LKQEATSKSIQIKNHGEIVMKSENKASHESEKKGVKFWPLEKGKRVLARMREKGVEAKCGEKMSGERKEMVKKE